mmetsp:Transcript_3397/g.9060  ORF Transcript_3397/g.9060 Transcript_3397/m.9060 type:complete len:123 (-) Transcript_3397:91-459(-)
MICMRATAHAPRDPPLQLVSVRSRGSWLAPHYLLPHEIVCRSSHWHAPSSAAMRCGSPLAGERVQQQQRMLSYYRLPQKATLGLQTGTHPATLCRLSLPSSWCAAAAAAAATAYAASLPTAT